jgi:hypothetical protein
MTESEIENARLVPVKERKTPAPRRIPENMVPKEDWDSVVDWIQKMLKKEYKNHPKLKDLVKSSDSIDDLMERYDAWKKEKRQRKKSWSSEFARISHKLQKLMCKKYMDEEYVAGRNVQYFEKGRATVQWTWEKKD